MCTQAEVAGHGGRTSLGAKASTTVVPLPHVHELVIEDEYGFREIVPLTAPELTIGRTESNSVRLAERTISRNHARVTLRDGNVTIQPIERPERPATRQRTSIWVNGQLVDGATELTTGDEVRIGDFKLELRVSGEFGTRNTLPWVLAPTTEELEAIDTRSAIPAAVAPESGQKATRVKTNSIIGVMGVAGLVAVAAAVYLLTGSKTPVAPPPISLAASAMNVAATPPPPPEPMDVRSAEPPSAAPPAQPAAKVNNAPLPTVANSIVAEPNAAAKRGGERNSAQAPSSRTTPATHAARAPTRPGEMYAAAMEKLKQDDANGAIKLLEACVKVSRKNYACYKELGGAYRKLASVGTGVAANQQAVAAYRKYLRFAPTGDRDRPAIKKFIDQQ